VTPPEAIRSAARVLFEMGEKAEGIGSSSFEGQERA
jgi:hypothetical protein